MQPIRHELVTGFVFFDDMSSDVDGLGAATILALSGKPVYGLITTTNSRYSARTMAVLDQHYGLDARIGWDQRGSTPTSRDPFSRQIASEFPNGRQDRITGSGLAFRRAVRDAKRDGTTVRVIATGALDTVARAMDGLKPRLRDFVTGLTVMAGSTVSGRSEFNVRLSPDGANAVAKRWPTAIRWLPFEQGVDVLTGSVLANRPGPTRRGYRLYPSAGNTRTVGDTRSWDKVAVTHALRPDLFRVSGQRQPFFRDDGTSTWERKSGTRQRLLTMRSTRDVTAYINRMLSRA